MSLDGAKHDCTVPTLLRRIEKGQQVGLAMQARLTPWTTPTTNQGRNETSGRQEGSAHHSGQTLQDQVWGMTLNPVASGTILTSSTAETASTGVLNPAFPAWLMGFPSGGTIPGWNTSSPGYESWVTVQSLLAEYWQKHGTTAASDSRGMGTPSSPSSESGS
jgi:hypothetical protein